MTDLTKAFDPANYELFTAKPHAYGLDFTALKLIHSYLIKWKEKKQIRIRTRCFTRISCGVLFLSVHICDLSYFIIAWEAENYADDATLFTSGRAIASLALSLLKNIV